MAEEFQESDVIFHDHDLTYFDFQDFNSHHIPTGHTNMVVFSNSKKKKKNKKSIKKLTSTSLPVNIPDNVLHMADMEDPFEDEYDGDELVPPHVIVGRRVAGKMEFAVCTGNGRTLKGRDLSQVRDSILRMTGFLES